MSGRLLFLLLVAGIGTGAAARETRASAGDKDNARRFARLVADLGRDDYEAREAAAAELLAAGAAARPALEKALTDGDPEVRRVARDLIAHLARRAEASEVLEPRPFRLAYRDVPLSYVLEDFARRTGCRVSLDPAVAPRLNDKKITLDTGTTSFWDALASIGRAAGLTEKKPAPGEVTYSSPNVYSGRGFLMKRAYYPGNPRPSGLPSVSTTQIVMTEGQPPAWPTFRAGSLRLRALPPGSPLGDWTATKGDEEVFLGLEVASEPSVGWQGVQSLRVEKAVDDAGQVLGHPQSFHLAPPQPNPYEDVVMWESSYSYAPAAASGGGEHVPMRLRLGKRPATRLKELRGTATVKLQTPPQPVVAIENILKSAAGGAKGDDGTQLKVIEWQREAGGALKLRVSVEYPQPQGANMWGGFRRWGGSNGLEGGLRNLVLYDANGHLVRQTAAEHLDDGTGGPSEYRVTFQPAPGQAEPTRLVLEGRRTVIVDVPFVLRDVPLR